MDQKLPSIVRPILIVAGVMVVLTLMHLATSFLGPVLMSIFFATLLTPIYGWLKRRMRGWLALVLSILLLVLIAAFLVLLIGQSLNVLEENLDRYEQQFSQRQAELEEGLDSISPTLDLSPLLGVLDPERLAEMLGSLVSAVAGLVKNGVLMLILTTFLLVEGPVFKKGLVQAFGEASVAAQKTLALARIMIRYFGARAVVNLANAVATGLMLWLFDIPYVGLWVVLIFFLSFIPYIGSVLAMIPPVLLAYAQGGLGLALIIILLAVIINAVAENVLQPVVMGVSLSVSPTVAFLSTLLWTFILGTPGALLAMPLTMGVILMMENFAETRGLASMMMRK
jgi:AI-2 transport protein TqsA